MKFISTIVLLLVLISLSSKKQYQKNYFKNGKLSSEGWLLNDIKTDYWKFYHDNGVLKSEGYFDEGLKTKYWKFYRVDGTKLSEGHFINDKKSKWWSFYNSKEKINHKCQLKNNQKNGYCLMFKNEKLVSAIKYFKGKKIKEWTNLSSFKKENRLIDLR